MKTIVLYGNNDSGKTTTLSMVYTTLVSNGAAVHEFKVMPNNNPNEEEDFETLLFYQSKVIAICSYGDIKPSSKKKELKDIKPDVVKDFYEKELFYGDKNVDVLIVADSTGSAMATPPICKLQKTLSNTLSTSSEVQANAIDCHKIISLI